MNQLGPEPANQPAELPQQGWVKQPAPGQMVDRDTRLLQLGCEGTAFGEDGHFNFERRSG
jgi:hypothetical protein